MRPRSNTLFPLALIAGLTLLSFWLQHVVQGPEKENNAKLRHDPDFIVENFTSTSMNKQGRPTSKLTAIEMRHFPDDESTELKQPKLVQLEEAGPPVHVTAERGKVNGTGEEVRLYGNVVVWREATPQQAALRMETTYLQVFPDDDLARTPERVVITQAGSRLVGTGMEVNSKTGKFVLKSKVTGQFTKAAS
jgi:lipopolysaccharide export system protein LptC